MGLTGQYASSFANSYSEKHKNTCAVKGHAVSVFFSLLLKTHTWTNKLTGGDPWWPCFSQGFFQDQIVLWSAPISIVCVFHRGATVRCTGHAVRVWAWNHTWTFSHIDKHHQTHDHRHTNTLLHTSRGHVMTHAQFPKDSVADLLSWLSATCHEDGWRNL